MVHFLQHQDSYPSKAHAHSLAPVGSRGLVPHGRAGAVQRWPGAPTNRNPRVVDQPLATARPPGARPGDGVRPCRCDRLTETERRPLGVRLCGPPPRSPPAAASAVTSRLLIHHASIGHGRPTDPSTPPRAPRLPAGPPAPASPAQPKARRSGGPTTRDSTPPHARQRHM
jgi:hypothetical protein